MQVKILPSTSLQGAIWNDNLLLCTKYGPYLHTREYGGICNNSGAECTLMDGHLHILSLVVL